MNERMKAANHIVPAPSAFLLTNNGAAYQVAHTAAILEALIEYYFFPHLKTPQLYTTGLGLLLMLLGQTARTLAMKHAGRNFSHYVKSRHESGHVLVKDGVYAYLRHPSYFGYFWWAVGTQVMLANPVCVVAFVVVLWRFFAGRVRSECSVFFSHWPPNSVFLGLG